ncbi:MAG: (E)-4-hydroxy-3-methylbut-2-enyl-diphosphate synthase [Ginsengibacter sp.]
MQLFTGFVSDYKRLPTLEVQVGELLIGNYNPVRIQTMTTTDTMDTMATVEQSIRCINAGAELVRITAPSKNEAENLANIKQELRKRGYTTPLVADIHFTPNAAEIAARIVEKVRINPGNYVDKKKFELKEYTDSDYLEEIERIKDRFTPLIKICKEYGTAMRIGTNHGSLSDRIMSRYGDTAIGMVESAMEFLRIAEAENYFNIVLSMKSSNPQVMVQAYRLLIQNMQAELGHNYPLHLGVTEAGDGEDGRIKSAIGIGTLLEDGIGDTIRVSLTEEPEFEIPVCRDIVNHIPAAANLHSVPDADFLQFNTNPVLTRFEVGNIGGKHVPVVIADLSKMEHITSASLKEIGYAYDAATDKWTINDTAADYVYTANKILDFPLPGTLKVILNNDAWQLHNHELGSYPIFEEKNYLDESVKKSSLINFVMIDCFSKGYHPGDHSKLFESLKDDPTAVICLNSTARNAVHNIRKMFVELKNRHILNPIIFICDSNENSMEKSLVHYAIETGSLLIDGMGNGLCLGDHFTNNDFCTDYKVLNSIAFGILQATRTRISKTEYISCPSCGRTLFDLQVTTSKIRAVTSHLKGVKIAIMGCIVNGPGEMADADFGYVGSGPGKVTLYRGKEVIKRSVAEEVAVSELINLIRESEAWIEP